MGRRQLLQVPVARHLEYISQEPDDYKFEVNGRRAYELKTNDELDDYTDIAEFIDVLNNTSDADLQCALEEVFNVADFLKVQAHDVVSGNWDGYAGNKSNFYLYHNPQTGLFDYIPYDLDNTWGIDWLNQDRRPATRMNGPRNTGRCTTVDGVGYRDGTRITSSDETMGHPTAWRPTSTRVTPCCSRDPIWVLSAVLWLHDETSSSLWTRPRRPRGVRHSAVVGGPSGIAGEATGSGTPILVAHEVEDNAPVLIPCASGPLSMAEAMPEVTCWIDPARAHPLRCLTMGARRPPAGMAWGVKVPVQWNWTT